MHHTDAGSQYTSVDYTQTLADHGVLASVGTVGDAYDNALAESFVDSFKTELIADRVWRTRSQLELAIVEYVAWFNNERLHEALDDRPPARDRGTLRCERQGNHTHHDFERAVHGGSSRGHVRPAPGSGTGHICV